jgi:hypothetical protein
MAGIRVQLHGWRPRNGLVASEDIRQGLEDSGCTRQKTACSSLDRVLVLEGAETAAANGSEAASHRSWLRQHPPGTRSRSPGWPKPYPSYCTLKGIAGIPKSEGQP